MVSEKTLTALSQLRQQLKDAAKRDRMQYKTITCPVCEETSAHPNDIRDGYCGRCHWWTSDPILGPLRSNR